MNWFLGTMGFSYSEWRGVFYPSEMPAHNYLKYYSRFFNSVEIDSTFYGIPRKTSIKRWHALTPDHFKFCVKAPRIITHDLGLENSLGLTVEFLQRVSLLDNKLGVVLFQFPPSFTVHSLDRLADFLSNLPIGYRYAIEVRDRTWYSSDDEFKVLLISKNICWVATEYPGVPREIIRTTNFMYMRWVGKHGSYPTHDQLRSDRIDNMHAWLEKINDIADDSTDIYGFFNDDYAGFAAGSAAKFKSLIGLHVNNFIPPQQGTLFK